MAAASDAGNSRSRCAGGASSMISRIRVSSIGQPRPPGARRGGTVAVGGGGGHGAAPKVFSEKQYFTAKRRPTSISPCAMLQCMIQIATLRAGCGRNRCVARGCRRLRFDAARRCRRRVSVAPERATTRLRRCDRPAIAGFSEESIDEDDWRAGRGACAVPPGLRGGSKSPQAQRRTPATRSGDAARRRKAHEDAACRPRRARAQGVHERAGHVRQGRPDGEGRSGG